MKKPNIKAPWMKDGSFIKNCELDEVCEITEYIESYQYQEEINRKAISAVPEMIDALIESYYQLSTLVNSDDTEHVYQDELCLKNIEQALKKAGCTQ